LALNEAIDSYRPGPKSFGSYAYLVAMNRLRDYFRRERRHRHLPLDRPIGDEADPGEASHRETMQQAWVEYHNQQAARERARELALFRQELERCGIDLHELPDVSPQHEDTRQSLIRVAEVLLVPLSKLVRRVEVSRKTLKRWRRFVVAVALILAHPEWEHLNAFYRQRFGSPAKRAYQPGGGWQR